MKHILVAVCWFSKYSINVCLAFLHSVLLVPTLYPDCLGNWNSLSYFIVALTSCWEIDSFLISQKLWRIKHAWITCIKSLKLMSISLFKQPNLALSLPNVHSITILAEDNRKPWNCSDWFFPPFANSLLTKGNNV